MVWWQHHLLIESLAMIRYSGYSCYIEINNDPNLTDAYLIQKPKRDNIIEIVADTFVLLLARFHLVCLVKNIMVQWELGCIFFLSF